VTHGAWVRGLSRDEAEIAIACLRDWGFSARMRAAIAPVDRPAERDGGGGPAPA
jgi:hypothetical protein